MIPFNLNEHVWIRLTKAGEEILEKKLPHRFEDAVNSEGYKANGFMYLEFQLWEIMQVFGDKMCNGCKNLIHENVIDFKTEHFANSETLNQISAYRETAMREIDALEASLASAYPNEKAYIEYQIESKKQKIG